MVIDIKLIKLLDKFELELQVYLFLRFQNAVLDQRVCRTSSYRPRVYRCRDSWFSKL